MEDRVEVLRNDKIDLRVQNLAACDAKSIMEIGLIRGLPRLEIIQKCHEKLREVTPDLIIEDLRDPEAAPIIQLPNIGMEDKATQT